MLTLPLLLLLLLLLLLHASFERIGGFGSDLGEGEGRSERALKRGEETREA